LKKIDIPLYAIRHTQIGGTEFALYNLIHGLCTTGIEVALHVGRERDLSKEFLSWTRDAPGVTLSVSGGLPGPKGMRFLEELWFSQRQRTTDWTLFPNYFCPPSVLHRAHAPAVILHDIQYKCFPQYHSLKRRMWLDSYLPLMFQHSEMVALISRSELSLVEQHFGHEAAAKCAVIHNAIDWNRLEYSDSEESQISLPEKRDRYILSVCHQFPHKNVHTLLKAFSVISQQDDEVELYLVGSCSTENRDFVHRILRSDVADRVHLTGFVSDADLGRLYSGAEMFVLPSLYEGFGMPAVEALGLGVPTIVSNSYALPEVTLGHADYVDNPLDVDEWVDAITGRLGQALRVPLTAVEAIRSAYDPGTIAKNLVTEMAKRR
jgi:glycosyltransferase involved in cell wall biosynthesis